MSYKKYKQYPPIDLPERKWPSKIIEKAPIWCSVDLRDGNQALPTPMNVEEKIDMFNLLVDIGFKEIELGFPSASNTEFAFARNLIENKLIPDDVTIQLLTQARRHLIERSFEAIQGAKKVIVHFYNSTSELQRRVVFNKSKKEIIDIAREGAVLIKTLSKEYTDTNIVYEYSPESFTGTELDFAVEICEEVMNVIEPTTDNKLILNLPATIEMSTPNIYADQIEWFLNKIKNRDKIILSVHAHNDRGTSVAATELALLAGADRVEGTLFGNGERTGNVDILNLGMNMYSQGIDPKLDFSNINKIVSTYEKNTRLHVHPRHPYAGKLVYTAFSGSHQDAISKGMNIYAKEQPEYWEVPYLPIDPSDLGREYESIIRINSQSGKGGVAYIMENEFGYKLPKEMRVEFGAIIKEESDKRGDEFSPQQIFSIFQKEYLEIDSPYKITKYERKENEAIDNNKNKSALVKIKASLIIDNEEKTYISEGKGPVDAFFNLLKLANIFGYNFLNYSEHALSEGSDSKAVSYIQLENEMGEKKFGVGIAQNITSASIKAILNAINRFCR
ncbi:MAG TPA: 2-isopropylmalate synthase [Spirochaetota bacterium]|nr:2-isopropylmalate synthase [Spirochaetota bacterium]